MVLGELREAGGGIDHQRRADDDEQIGQQGFPLRPAHGVHRHGLAERNGGGFYQPIAPQAARGGALGGEFFPQRRQIVALPAGQAGGVQGVAVQFHHQLLRHAGGLVQPVDILGNHGGGLAGGNQIGDRAMAAIRQRALKHRIHRKATAPGFNPRRLGGDEGLKLDRRQLGPHPTGAAEIWNAGLGADARAGEHHHARRGLDQVA